MARIETSALLVEIDDRFAQVRTLGADLGAKVVPETITSPGMGLGLLEIEVQDRTLDGVASPDRRLDRMLGDEKASNRRPITAAGLSGITLVVEDTLKDYDTGKTIAWFRHRALLLDSERDVFVHATAMYAKADRDWVEAAFFAMLDSVTFKVSADEAAAAIDESEAMLALALERAKAAMDEAAAQTAETEKALETAVALGPVPDVEERFAAALEAAGLTPKREELRPIAVPCVHLIEEGEVEAGETGLSRIGGDPDLAASVDWPRDPYGLHLNFLAQVDVADLPFRDPCPPRDRRSLILLRRRSRRRDRSLCAQRRAADAAGAAGRRRGRLAAGAADDRLGPGPLRGLD